MNINKVFLAGNITRDPDLRYTPSGKGVLDISVAVNRRFKDNEETTFVDVTLWDRAAENVAKYLKKGDPIFIEGRLQQERWEKDGEKRSKMKVVADHFEFISTKGKAQAPSADVPDDDNIPY